MTNKELLQPKMNNNSPNSEIVDILSPEEKFLLFAELSKPVTPAIRLNPLKVSPQDLSTWCDKYGWETKPIPFCSTGYWLTKLSSQPGRTIEHKLGRFYIQDAASMLPAELFDFSRNQEPIILDMAASPGGKTTHLCSKIMDQGFLVANDSSRDRIQALKLVLQTWGVVNQAISQLPGVFFGKFFPETFDAVLLDAPCSMQGLRSTERHPIRTISKNEQSGLVKRQIELLESSLKTVKTGGQVVYSTCTLSPEENECVLDVILSLYGKQVSITDVSSRLGIRPALTSFNDKQLHQSVSGAARIWPHTFGTAGFFAALITKHHRIEESSLSDRLPFFRSDEAYDVPSQKAIEEINEKFAPFISKSILEIIEQTHTDILKKGNFWFLIPKRVKVFSSILHFQSLGMMLAEETPDGILPSHEFCSRFSSILSGEKIELSNEKAVQWFLGQDLSESIQLSGTPYAIIVDENGKFLGRGKCLHNRIRNLLPRHLL